MKLKEMFGWEIDKNVNDFLIIADMLEKEGKESRSKAIRYLVERVKLAEDTKKSLVEYKICPKCGSPLLEREDYWACSDEYARYCDYYINKES